MPITSQSAASRWSGLQLRQVFQLSKRRGARFSIIAVWSIRMPGILVRKQSKGRVVTTGLQLRFTINSTIPMQHCLHRWPAQSGHTTVSLRTLVSAFASTCPSGRYDLITATPLIPLATRNTDTLISVSATSFNLEHLVLAV